MAVGLDREQLPIYAIIAALSGTTGIGGSLMAHNHPEIISEIREVAYEQQIEKAKTAMFALDEAGVDHSDPDYIIAEAQLRSYTKKLSDLEE